MKDIRNLKIVGIDSARPPKVRKEPYIDLIFQLSDRATKEWCQDFNMLFSNTNYSVKVDTIDCLYIETWVRTMGEISEHLNMLKEKVTECNQAFYDRQVARNQEALNKNTAVSSEGGLQGKLNEIIANLNYD